MAELLHTQGVLLHSRRDWPCACCRPDVWDVDGITLLLCLDCAVEITAACVQKIQREGLDLVDEIEGWVAQKRETESAGRTPSWRLPGSRGPKSR